MHGVFAWIADTVVWVLAFSKAHPEWAFAIALLSAFAESFVGISFLVPGTSILIGLGVVVQQTGISPIPLWLGKALAFFSSWGVWAIFLGRFLGPFRATVPIVAGISQMKFWPFQIANVSSAIVWSASLLALGAMGAAALGPLGEAWRWAYKEHVFWYALAVVIAATAALILWWARRKPQES